MKLIADGDLCPDQEIIHQGRNIKGFREMLGIKQEALAIELGEEWNQRKISLLGAKEIIDPDLLEHISKVLKVPIEAIENFDAEQVIQNISNTFHDSSFFHNHINSADKIIELYEQRIITLYERMLQSEKEKVEFMKQVLDKAFPKEKLS